MTSVKPFGILDEAKGGGVGKIAKIAGIAKIGKTGMRINSASIDTQML
jgi:hypothetical protein